ncbi:hypothetical protein AAC387_Pa09g1541 [Persea americana]
MLEACGFSCPFPLNDTVTCLSQPHNKKETASGMQMGDYNYQRHFHLGFHRKQKLRTEDNVGLHFPCSMDSSVHDLSVDVLLELKKIESTICTHLDSAHRRWTTLKAFASYLPSP